LQNRKIPPRGGIFLKTHSIGWTELTVSLLPGIMALSLTILLLLAGFLTAALLLARFLARILTLLARVLIRVVFVRIGHSGNSLVE